MFKHTKLHPLLAGTALLAALPLAVCAQGKEPIRIGLVTSRSGGFSTMGADVARGIGFAVDEANAKGGVDGRRIILAEGDDESTPDAGRRVAEKLARDGHNLLIGPITSSISLAISQNLARWDAAFIGTISKADKLTTDACNPRFVRTNHSDAMDLAMIGEWVKGIEGNDFAILAADYVWGQDSAKSFEAAVTAQGKKVSLKLFAPLGTKDYAPYIQQIKAANVDAIWVADVSGGIAFVKQAADFNLIPKTPLIGHALVSNFVIDATGKAMANVPGNVGFTPDIDTPQTKAFVSAFKARHHRLPSDTEGQAYNGAMVLFQGVTLAKSVQPEAVTKALRGARVDTLYGKMTIRAADNQLVMPNYVARVKMADGVLRPVIEHTYPASLVPAASPLCKM
ncbi:ABC transporter substrate-binding protein [Verminephrobacter eiseniae]|uniref:Extracellular ligand-binding receptor n=1 Tax=Verminephrobacter eiseniae (strain EF01-2) TaxID=391735 RepID=A1WQB0_VEREI|nr:ABC transporter substrate-binding protein [Verminephrobacter eiseniae]ABM59817.1 Extracellular ligand-binding receptor [Verminephrobacter eiseniae EF01-2]MCW5285329.1 branched-chain amino acid ABC transporter substrate-binding protein [Verminephrobacter eiseniae]MCW5303037.1 branched-chain amino acid ABC transporter substrate-binding protein [Verminephrobacter eiseniae]MCW8179641.1 branched-chain amino acid ABC transporter substrate-binding protein [Verminephrobacter eiseniae]MCW8190473.1 b